MKKLLLILTFFIITIVVLTNPESQSYSIVKELPNNTEQALGEIPIEFENEEVDETVTECQDCLTSAKIDGCFEIHSDCFDLPDCSEWLSCVGWCEAYEGDDDCYFQCDDNFIDKDEVEVDLRICACEICGMECRVLCGAESY